MDGTEDLREESLELAEGAISHEADEIVIDPNLPNHEEGGRRDVSLL